METKRKEDVWSRDEGREEGVGCERSLSYCLNKGHETEEIRKEAQRCIL